MADLQDFAGRLNAWAARTFPNATTDGAVQHLLDEAAELELSITLGMGRPLMAEEAADCLILLLRVAHLEGFDLLAAAERKFEELQMRTWGAPDARGVVRHIDEERARRGR